VEAAIGAVGVATLQRPLALLPLVAFAGADDLGQVHAGQAREGARLGHRGLGVERLARRGGHDAARLGAFLAQHAGQLAGVEPGDGDHVLGLEVGIEALAHAEVRGQDRQVANHQTCGMHPVGLDVLCVHTGVADVRIGQRDDLAAVARVGQDFLITRHGSVEHHLADRAANRADTLAVEDRSVGKRKKGGRECTHEKLLESA